MAEGAAQESLFVISDQAGQIVVRDFNPPAETDASVSIIERDLHLQNVITNLAAMSMRNGFLSFDGPAETYGEHAERVRTSVKNQLKVYTAQAKHEFSQASGHTAMLDAGVPEIQARGITRGLFSDFAKKYYGSRHYKEAQALRHHLANHVEIMQGRAEVEPAVRPQQLPTAPEMGPKPSLAFLNTQERLQAISADPRAAFLPATHREKNTVLTFLDYLDNPAYPRRTADQLIEVFRHQQKPQGAGSREGQRAVESISYELGDFLANAVASHNVLADLQVLINDCPNPYVTLAEEVGDYHAGYGVLQRFLDLSELRDQTRVADLRRDPLRTREFRWAKDGPGKRKAVEDQYTALEPKQAFVKRMNRLTPTITIGQARHMVVEAVNNEEKRALFFQDRLRDLRKLPGRHIFKVVWDVAEATLSEQQLKAS